MAEMTKVPDVIAALLGHCSQPHLDPTPVPLVLVGASLTLVAAALHSPVEQVLLTVHWLRGQFVVTVHWPKEQVLVTHVLADAFVQHVFAGAKHVSVGAPAQHASDAAAGVVTSVAEAETTVEHAETLVLQHVSAGAPAQHVSDAAAGLATPVALTSGELPGTCETHVGLADVLAQAETHVAQVAPMVVGQYDCPPLAALPSSRNLQCHLVAQELLAGVFSCTLSSTRHP